MIISLLGYMGAGKSTVGKQLAEILEFRFLDLDDYIESKEDCTVSEIFERKGEIYFRRLETKCLEEIIANEDKIILSLGGGTPCYANNMNIISKDNNLSVYLKMTPKALSDRLFINKNTRPLIAHIETKDKLLEFISIHLFERQDFYNAATNVITIDGLTPNEVVKQVVRELY